MSAPYSILRLPPTHHRGRPAVLLRAPHAPLPLGLLRNKHNGHTSVDHRLVKLSNLEHPFLSSSSHVLDAVVLSRRICNRRRSSPREAQLGQSGERSAKVHTRTLCDATHILSTRQGENERDRRARRTSGPIPCSLSSIISSSESPLFSASGKKTISSTGCTAHSRRSVHGLTRSTRNAKQSNGHMHTSPISQTEQEKEQRENTRYLVNTCI